MRKMIAWFATNHVAANLVMGFSVFAGLAALERIPVKLYPDVDVPLIIVTVPYLGAAPEEVESGVCTRVEESLEGVNGIREVRSASVEDLCTVQIELFFDTDRMQTLGEVENRINAIDTFPEEAEKPIIEAATVKNVVIEVAVTGTMDERSLKEMGRRVRDDLLRLPGITQAAIVNERPYEISVEVSEASLSRNNLTFDDVAQALRKRSLDLPGGSVKTDRGEILLRTAGQAYWGARTGKADHHHPQRWHPGHAQRRRAGCGWLRGHRPRPEVRGQARRLGAGVPGRRPGCANREPDRSTVCGGGRSGVSRRRRVDGLEGYIRYPGLPPAGSAGTAACKGCFSCSSC